MEVIISFTTDSAAFEDNMFEEVRRIMDKATCKVLNQMLRQVGCICTAPEADDILHDMNGNQVGTVVVKRDPPVVMSYSLEDVGELLDSIYEDKFPDGVPEEYIERAARILSRKFDHSTWFLQAEAVLQANRDVVEGR